MANKSGIDKSTLKKSRELNWYRHGVYRNNFLFASFCTFTDAKKMNKDPMLRVPINTIWVGEEAYLIEEEVNSIVDSIYPHISNDFLKRYIQRYQKDNKKFLDLAIKINKDPKISSMKDFFRCSHILSYWLWNMEFLNPGVDRYLREKIKIWQPSWDGEKIDDFISKISYSHHMLAFQQEQDEILDKKADKEKLFKKYAWLKMNTWEGRPFTRKEYEERIKHPVKISYEEIKESQEIVKKIKDKEMKELILLIQELIYLKSYRIDVLTESWYLMLDIIDMICKKMKISYETFLTLSQEEIISLKMIVPKDRKHFAIVQLENKYDNYFGKSAMTLRKELLRKDYSQIREFSGNIAYKGKVIGPARVISTDREIYKVKKGDILVCNLTNPNYNPVFPRVAGIITDEGGILCHSAIMAREFKIPCIIGTKFATRILKDGDMVEVDAVNGMVRKLGK